MTFFTIVYIWIAPGIAVFAALYGLILYSMVVRREAALMTGPEVGIVATSAGTLALLALTLLWQPISTWFLLALVWLHQALGA